MKVTVHVDGGSRGNPGPAAAAFILANAAGNRLAGRAFVLGETTNNVAEYTALLRALEAAGALGATDVTVFSDSELLVRQLTGLYKVKSDSIRPLYEQVNALRMQFDGFSIRHVMREQNKEADRLVNEALDAGRDITEGTAKPQRKLRLGVLISGGGRTTMNILDCINRGELNAEIALVISSLSTSGGVEKTRRAGLPLKIVRKKDCPDIDTFSEHVVRELDAANVDLVVQGGWLCLWKIPPRCENRVMNIHPALLPSFGGKGMWGHHVHEAVLAAGCKVSGCTVHFCTNEYDRGPIIVQRTCPVADDDTPDTLAERVFQQECLAYPQAIRWFAEDRLVVDGNRVRIVKDSR
ncbi:MAG: phosphoribosylglycinamide formyltransferase [Sedimentisphaerales bacterium]|nr:phosphoribosylglycinamide formyltransferase [Sedimentisphaerales bacterium]